MAATPSSRDSSASLSRSRRGSRRWSCAPDPPTDLLDQRHLGVAPASQTLYADAMVLVQGTLAAHVPLTAPIAQSFGAAGGGYRYLQFVPTSVAANDPATSIACGLNELRVFGNPQRVSAVPEPSTWALLIAGFGMIDATLRRPARRRAVIAWRQHGIGRGLCQ